MAGTIWSKFFWADWLSDAGLRACSAPARGLWMDMLCIAAAHNPVGYVAIAGRGLTTQEIARIACSDVAAVEAAIKELELNHVFDRNMAGLISSRRMIRDFERDSRKGICEQCGRPYNRQRSDSQYCSRLCRQKAYRDRNSRNANRNANRNAYVTLSVTKEPLSVTQETAGTIGKDNGIASARYGSSRARARDSTCQNPDRILPLGGESERQSGSEESKENRDPSLGGTATALDGRAVPLQEEGSRKPDKKRPHELTKAEFEAQLKARRKP